MLGMSPGMMEFMAKMALENPERLATMAAAKGIAPPAGGMAGGMAPAPAGGALPMAPGPATGMSPTQMVNPTGAPTAAGGKATVSVPQPAAAAPGPTAAQVATATTPAASALGALATPSAAAGGGGGGNAPAPFIPGALQPQTLDIVKALMASPTIAPNLGSLILGR